MTRTQLVLFNITKLFASVTKDMKEVEKSASEVNKSVKLFICFYQGAITILLFGRAIQFSTVSASLLFSNLIIFKYSPVTIIFLENPCHPSPCHSYATCSVEHYRPVCKCIKGYEGNGQVCKRSQ